MRKPPAGRKNVMRKVVVVYLVEDEYLVTAFVPSETACFASSPGRMSRTLARLVSDMPRKPRAKVAYDVWISRDEIVDFLL